MSPAVLLSARCGTAETGLGRTRYAKLSQNQQDENAWRKRNRSVTKAGTFVPSGGRAGYRAWVWRRAPAESTSAAAGRRRRAAHERRRRAAAAAAPATEGGRGSSSRRS